jgi:sugar phosphate isomerase/epimerase
MTTLRGLALHTWTLDTTPLDAVLRVARETGWDAVELRRADFARAAQAGTPAEAVLEMVRASGLAVACVGVQAGWLFAEGAQQEQLLEAFAESCGWAAALHCRTVMSPVDPGRGPLDRAAASIARAAAIAATHDVRLALEFNSVAEQLNSLAAVRALTRRAAHPRCGILLDTYHLGRSGATLQELEDLAPDEIAYVQYSDVPAGALPPGVTTNRLPPGRGTFPFTEFFRLLQRKGYGGHASYEAPNPSAWAQAPAAVAGEALAATKRVLPAG